jgi:hypothetical protein
MQKLDLGVTLSKAFTIFFQGLPTLLGIAIPIYTPYIALEYFSPGPIDEFTGIRASNPYATLLSFFIGPFVTAAATYEVLERLRGARAGVVECLLAGVRRLVPVFFVTLLSWLAIVAGTICLIIPGIFMFVVLSVAIPACVVERPGVLRSLERSFDLTQGSRWSIFAILLVFTLLAVMLFVVLIGVAYGAKESGVSGVGEAVRWGLIVLAVLFGVLQAVLSATIYHELRTKKEGAQSDDLVQVFA